MLLRAADWYESNPIGMALNGIPFSEREMHEWVLMKEERESEDVTILFHQLKEDKKWVRTVDVEGRNTEAYYEKGVLKESYIYNSSGRPVEKTEYADDGKPAGKSIYYYSGSDISSVEVYSGGGTKIYEDIYLLREDKTLHSFQRFYQPPEVVPGAEEATMPESDVMIQIWQTDSRGNLIGMAIIRNGDIQVEQFSKSGALTGRNIFEGTLNVRRIVYLYDDGGKILTSIEENFLERTKVEKKYNPDGQVSSELSYDNDILVSLSEYSYNDQGRLIRKEKRGSGEHWLYLYQYEEDIKISESRYLDDLLHSRVIYDNESGSDRKEEFYKNGELFLITSYADNKKTKEEFYKDGVLTRTREYQ